MLRLPICVLFLTVCNIQAQPSQSPTRLAGVKPGSLLSMSTEELAQIPAARSMLASLPAAANHSVIVSCSYSSPRTGATSREVRHFWYGETPAWLSSVSAASPIRKFVPMVASQCPSSLASIEKGSEQSASAPGAGNTVAAETTSTVTRSRPPVTETVLTQASFVTSGLTHEQALKTLYLGNFDQLSFNRDDTVFVALFQKYLETYAQQCSNALPSNKVEMVRQECDASQYPVNKYGSKVGPSTCTHYTDVGTGLYADPDLYAAKTKLDAIVDSNALHNAFSAMAQGQRERNPMAAAGGILGEIQTSTSDMNALLKLNACTNPGLQRFQQNMMLFALGKQGLHLSSRAGTSLNAAKSAVSPSPATNNQNYTRLLEDLVANQSKTWLFNKYVSGSVTSVSVLVRDAAGRPSKLAGRYLFNGRSQGSVTVEFDDGLPQCMYFFDLPNSCRTPDRRIVSAFANGSYQK